MRRRVFSVLIEMIENVAKYSPGVEVEEKLGMPVAMIRFKNKTYSLTTGNLILNEKVSTLKGKMDTVNKYNREGLKELFRQALLEQTATSDSTGSMGLIDMARKSGSKLIYQFDRVNELYSYYTITVKVEEQGNQE
jgi:hypothetical protein